MTSVTHLKLRATDEDDTNEPQCIPGGGKDTAATGKCSVSKDLGNGSQVLYASRFISYQQSWNYLDYLNNNIPWTRPTIRVFGRSCVQVSSLSSPFPSFFVFLLRFRLRLVAFHLTYLCKIRFLTIWFLSLLSLSATTD